MSAGSIEVAKKRRSHVREEVEAVEDLATVTKLDLSHDHLEQRVKRLEDAVASIQDTRSMEERVYERLAKKLEARVIEIREPEVREHSTARRPLAMLTSLITPPRHQELHDSEPPTIPMMPVSEDTVRQAWLIVDIWKEFRTIFRMFFDVRYTIAWWTRILTIILAACILLSGWLLTPIYMVPLVGGALWFVADKAICLLIAFVMYKILSREAHRYRQTRWYRYPAESMRQPPASNVQ